MVLALKLDCSGGRNLGGAKVWWRGGRSGKKRNTVENQENRKKEPRGRRGRKVMNLTGVGGPKLSRAIYLPRLSPGESE